MLRDGGKTFETAELLYVSPADIRYYVRKNESIRTRQGAYLDFKGRTFEDMDIFVALKEHFEDGAPLSESKAHARILEQIKKGVSMWGCRSEDELIARWRKLDKLYFRIKTGGYKTQRQLGNPNVMNEVTVKIRRYGELLFVNGRHRLSIAKLLGLRSIPVRIVERHPDWVEFKARLLSYSEQHRISQPLLHPDLKSIPSSKGDERTTLVLNHLPCRRGEVMDIGANWGYSCHLLEDIGFTCYAVESDPDALYFLNRFRSIAGKHFTVLSKSLFDVEKVNYDIVLALDVLHRFLENEADYHRLTEFLGKLDMEFMFFRTHTVHEPQLRNAYKDYDELEFVEYILKHSCLSNHKLIGRSKEDNRGTYLLKR